MQESSIHTSELVEITVFDKLMESVSDFVSEQDKQLYHHPKEKLFYPDVFRLLMGYLALQSSSLKLFVSQLNHGLLPDELNLPKVPYSTLSEAFNRFSPLLFQEVFYHLLEKLPLKKVPELEMLGKLYCIDGSLFPLINSMLWGEYKSKKKALRLHLCFELNRMIPVDFLVDSGNSDERNALRKMLIPEVTYIADRGYMSFDLTNDIANAQAQFIFRSKSNLLYEVIERQEINIPENTVELFENLTDEQIMYTNDPHNNLYRLVKFTVGNEDYYLLSNRMELSTFQIIMLYAYRWQIELLFRFLKRSMKGIHLIKQDENGATIHFYGLMIMSLLELNLKQESIKINDNNSDNDEDKNSMPFEQIKQKKIFDPFKKEKCMESKKSFEKNSSKKKEITGRISEKYQFFKLIGNNINKYWKIGIHWLEALKNLLSKPFDQNAIRLLSNL